MFQSTHPHGVRLMIFTASASGKMFQSTHPHGVRQYKDKKQQKDFWVSIHAPTRGATMLCCKSNKIGQFQSTHPHGVRQLTLRNHKINITFQSTHPHGVRHKSRLYNHTNRFVSIHAPTRGATDLLFRLAVARIVSIHAPTRGATVYSANV